MFGRRRDLLRSAESEPRGLRDTSVVKLTVTNARRIVLAALAGVALIVAGLVAERILLMTRYERTTERLIEAHRLAGRIMLVDERLTMSANMAAATGEQGWIERYDANIPLIDDGIGKAIAIAPPEVAKRFDAETRVSNDRLVELERASMQEVQAGDLGAARQILDGRVYKYHKEVLGSGSEKFISAMIEAAQAEVTSLRRNALIAFSTGIVLAFFGGLTLWRRLGAGLDKTQAAYLEVEDRLKALAMNDVLTGLPNRSSLHEALNAIQTTAAAPKPFAVLCLDLDGFKAVNDTLGHSVGDALLKEVAARLTSCIAGDGMVARLGGDEFAILQNLTGGSDEAEHLAGRILDRIGEAYEIGGHRIIVSTSIGIALSPRDSTDAATLLQYGDLAMYRAKQDSGGGYRFFDRQMVVQAEVRHALEQGLREAIARQEFELHYQPVVNVGDGRVLGFEALLRWNHAARGLISPGEFIPVAEQTGLIVLIGEWVLQQACLAARSWPAELKVAVNVSAMQLRQRNFFDTVVKALAISHLSPRRLEIEITESAILDEHDNIAATLQRLRDIGISIALDDFGTGFSSFSHLRRLPCDRIKIDRSFVGAIDGESDGARAIVRSMVGLGRALHLDVVAEGVETQGQLDIMRAEGCTEIQGYLVSRPLPLAEIRRLYLEAPLLRTAVA